VSDQVGSECLWGALPHCFAIPRTPHLLVFTFLGVLLLYSRGVVVVVDFQGVLFLCWLRREVLVTVMGPEGPSWVERSDIV